MLGVAHAQTVPWASRPADGETPLPALNAWHASLVHESDVGIWTVGTCKPFDMFGAPEVYGLDDKGRCTILSSYSGRWTANQTVEDHKWLGSFSEVDLDPRYEGAEIYTGGQNGRLYEIHAGDDLAFDSLVVARFGAEEIHTTVAGDLLPSRPGNELLAFTRSGQAWEVRPPSEAGGEWTRVFVAQLKGRVRQAVMLPCASGEAPWFACATRPGQVLLLRMTDAGLDEQVVTDEPMGFGRIALRPPRDGQATVLYATRDDGLLLRFEQRADGSWARESVYGGPQGLRGVAAGRFHEDPTVESVVVFGYSHKVQHVYRHPGQAWQVETLFVDRDKGHWLSAAELDGRNGTDEILCSGYGGRIVLLARPPGYGADGLATDPDPTPRPQPGDTDGDDEEVARGDALGLRVGVAARVSDAPLSPLDYGGGFETKSLVFETLVRRGTDGRLVPGLAESWMVADDGRALTLHLRAGATFSDDTPADASAVAQHLRRVAGLPEHAWLRGTSHITSLEVLDATSLRIALDAPWDLLSELCAYNPCAIAAPSSRDREGRVARAIGSGPLRLLGAREDEPRTLLAERVDDGRRVQLVRYAGDELARAFDDVLAGRLDVLVDGSAELVPRERVDEARAAGLRVTSAQGASVVWLDLRCADGPLADVATRHAVEASLDRQAVIDAAEFGHADALRTLFTQSAGWPDAHTRDATPRTPLLHPPAPLRLLVDGTSPRELRAGRELQRQLVAGGAEVVLLAAEPDAYAAHLAEGTWELVLRRTWGVPYDPDVTLRATFLPPPAQPNAARTRALDPHDELAALVLRAAREHDERRRHAIHAELQDVIEALAPIVPLYAPRRLALTRAELPATWCDADPYRLDLDTITAR